MDSSTLQQDFGPSWSSHLLAAIPFNPEVAIIENEAWKDEIHTRANAPPEPTSVDPNTNNITNTTISSSTSELAIIQHKAWKDQVQLRDNSAPPESTRNLNTDIHSKPELALSEHDAWTDHIHFREYAPAEPTRVDTLGWVEKAEQAKRTRHGLLTPPETPTRYEREYSEGSSEEEAETESEEADENMWLNAYTAEQWALIKYGAARARFRDEAVVQGGDGQGLQEIGKMIVLYVFLAVLLHGIYTHRNESQNSGGCQCQCCQSPGFGNATGN
jgi:hypothetical protein